MVAGGAEDLLGYPVAPSQVHNGRQLGGAPAHTMAGSATQISTPQPESNLSASTQQPNFKEAVAAAVALALRNCDPTPPAKVPDDKMFKLSGKQSKWVDLHRSRILTPIEDRCKY